MKQYFILSIFLIWTRQIATAQLLEEIIRSNDDLTTLSSALSIVGWIPYDGDITMFLPNDDALSLLDPKYLTPGYIPHLKTIISYHAAPIGIVSSDMIADGTVLDMFGGTGSIMATVNDTGLFFSGASFSDAQVVGWDIMASNGLAYIVDQFFVPSQLTLTLLDLARGVSGFDKVLELLTASGLEEELTKENRTILAPSDTAFETLSSDFLAQIASDPDLRDDMLRYHILIASTPFEVITDGLQVMTALGAPVVFTVTGGGRFQQISVSNPGFGDAIPVETGNLVAMNGLAHAVSGVLETGPRPPQSTSSGDAPATSPETDGSVPAGSSASSMAQGIARTMLASSLVVIFL